MFVYMDGRWVGGWVSSFYRALGVRGKIWVAAGGAE